MKVFFAFTLLLNFAFANSVTDPILEFKDMQHEFPGCPINSDCSKRNGEKIKHWESFIEKLSEKNKVKKLKTYLTSHGLPLEFLSQKKSKIALDPILWNSRCKNHNPKNPNNNILRALKFFKEIPTTKHAVFTPVIIYEGTKEHKYQIPYQDQVVLLNGDQIITLKDYDDFYYQLSVSQDGKLNIENISPTMINTALDKKITETKCPTQMSYKKDYFLKSYCQKVYDIKSKKLKIIQYGWSCP